MESVDYTDTFIGIARDSTVDSDTVSRRGGVATVASATFDIIGAHPYRHRSSDVILTVWANRRDVPQEEREVARAEFHAKPRACLRSGDLGKRNALGIDDGRDVRVAPCAVGSPDYAARHGGRTPDGRPVCVTRAMRSHR